MRLKEIIIILIFLIFITLVFFYKIFLGLVPLPADLIVGGYYPWLEYMYRSGALGIPIHNPILSDAVSIFYPLKTLAVDLVKKGELPLWNPYMFGGYPLLASVQLGLFFPTMVFYFLFSDPIAWTIQVMFQPFLAAFFMHLFLRYIKLDKLSSLFGSVAYGFGGFISIWMEWNTQSTTALFLPILILLEDKYLVTKENKWGILFSIFLCLQIFAGYLPVISFTFIALALWYFLKSKHFLKDLKILFFVILGFSLSAIILLPVAELIQISQRVFEVININEALTPFEGLIRLVSPDFFGSYATANFWWRDSQAVGMYTGVITVIFTIIGISKYWFKIEVKFALALLFVTLIISTFNPLSIFLYGHGVWGNNSLTMNKTFFLINFSLAVLGAFGIFSIQKYSKLSLKPSLWVSSVILGTILGLLICQYFLVNTKISILSSVNDAEIVKDIETTLKNINISFRNLVLPVLIVIFISALIFIQNKFNHQHLLFKLVFISILIFELFRFGLKFNTFSSPEYIFPETPVTQFLEKYPNDRIIAEQDTLPSNMWVPFKVSSIGGYDGIYPHNIAQLIASANSDKADIPPQTRWGLVTNFNSKIIDESNTRLLVVVKRDEKSQLSENRQVNSSAIGPKYKEIFSDKGVVILENTQSLPRVYLTSSVIQASDQEILKLMLDDNFPVRTTSLSDFSWNNNSNKIPDQKLEYQQITNSHILVKTDTNLDSFLVVLDSYYPDWKAFVDGKKTEIHRTNYNFRGIVLPKGIHNVEFIYDPKSLKYGGAISGISLIILFLLLAIPRFYHQKK